MVAVRGGGYMGTEDGATNWVAGVPRIACVPLVVQRLTTRGDDGQDRGLPVANRQTLRLLSDLQRPKPTVRT